MKWKAVYTACIGLVIAGFAAFLISGWAWLGNVALQLRLGFLNRTSITYLILVVGLFLVLRYVWKQKQDDELPLILVVTGSFVTFVGSFIGPSTVFFGMLVILSGLVYGEHIYIQLLSPNRK